MPLINPEGFSLGSLCVLDFQPREITFEQGEAVRRLASRHGSFVSQIKSDQEAIDIVLADEQKHGPRIRMPGALIPRPGAASGHSAACRKFCLLQAG
jgi:hypothetical protein